MAETAVSRAIRDQTEILEDKLEEMRIQWERACEDWTDMVGALDHIAETLDQVQSHFTGSLSHSHPIPEPHEH